jgi:hypothetical protein
MMAFYFLLHLQWVGMTFPPMKDTHIFVNIVQQMEHAFLDRTTQAKVNASHAHPVSSVTKLA